MEDVGWKNVERSRRSGTGVHRERRGRESGRSGVVRWEVRANGRDEIAGLGELLADLVDGEVSAAGDAAEGEAVEEREADGGSEARGEGVEVEGGGLEERVARAAEDTAEAACDAPAGEACGAGDLGGGSAAAEDLFEEGAVGGGQGAGGVEDALGAAPPGGEAVAAVGQGVGGLVHGGSPCLAVPARPVAPRGLAWPGGRFDPARPPFNNPLNPAYTPGTR